MRQVVPCSVESLSLPNETVWIISIPMEIATDTALLLAGLLYGKVNRVKFADKSCTAALSVADGYNLHMDGTQIAVTKVWLEAVLGMLLDACLKGWSDIAHLDQNFGNISVTVTVLPPQK